MKKFFASLMTKYVRVFPYWEKAVICPLAKGCARACKCSEMSDKAYMFTFKPN